MMFQTCVTLFVGVFKEILDTYNDIMISNNEAELGTGTESFM